MGSRPPVNLREGGFIKGSFSCDQTCLKRQQGKDGGFCRKGKQRGEKNLWVWVWKPDCGGVHGQVNNLMDGKLMALSWPCFFSKRTVELEGKKWKEIKRTGQKIKKLNWNHNRDDKGGNELGHISHRFERKSGANSQSYATKKLKLGVVRS